MTTTEERMAATLYLLLYDTHRMYPSTATWHGGIGGQAFTMGCAFIDPAPDQAWVLDDLPSKALREFLVEHPEFDLKAAAELMRDELTTDLSGHKGES